MTGLAPSPALTSVLSIYTNGTVEQILSCETCLLVYRCLSVVFSPWNPPALGCHPVVPSTGDLAWVTTVRVSNGHMEYRNDLCWNRAEKALLSWRLWNRSALPYFQVGDVTRISWSACCTSDLVVGESYGWNCLLLFAGHFLVQPGSCSSTSLLSPVWASQLC